MKKVRQRISMLLLLSILGGALCPSLNVLAASDYMPSKNGSNTIVWAPDDDHAGSVTINDVTYPFFSDDKVSPGSYGFGTNLEELGQGYIPGNAGTPDGYAEQIKQNYPDIIGVGASHGELSNYAYRMMTMAYGVNYLHNYASTVKSGNPDDTMYASNFDAGATFSFTVGNVDYTMSDTFSDFITSVDGGTAWAAIGLDDADKFKTLFGQVGGNPAGNVITESEVQNNDNADEWGMAAYAGAYNTIAEFYVYATKYREQAYGSGGDTAPYKTLQEVADALATLQVIVHCCDSYYPILDELWEYKTNNSMSLREMYEASDGEYAPGGTNIDLDNTFDKVLDENSPLGLFYIINTDTGIARIDKESVLNDIDIDRDSEALVKEWNDYYYGKEDGVNKEVITEMAKDAGILANNIVGSQFTGTVLGAVDQEGTALTTGAVSMSDYITEGITYSSTFVPMKTNLYSPDTLSQFSQEFREEFYYKYGFMRKALLWDKSGTAAVDFYNANGKCTGVTSTVTLRDLLESGDNDIALYVDNDFYNADEAIAESNELLELRNEQNAELAQYISDYFVTLEILQTLMNQKDVQLTDILAALNTNLPVASVVVRLYKDNSSATMDTVMNKVSKEIKNKFNYDITTGEQQASIEYAEELMNAVNYSRKNIIDDHVLKTGDYSQYSNKTEALLKQCTEFNYRKIEETEPINNDNRDSIVLPSSTITAYMDATSSYENRVKKDEEGVIVVNRYTSYDDYTPMLPMSYVSALYREGNYYSLANLVAPDNPVFLASDDLCGIEDASQWYCNTILNYAFVKNLKSAAQVDYTYTVDLDCPLYIDVFGNILTESGVVVIPAACNATLHAASYKGTNVAVGLYTIYGKDYYVPMDCVGAAKAMFPFFAVDKDEGVYIVNGNAVTIGTDSVQYDTISPYDVSTQDVVMQAYKSYIKDGKVTNYNWIAMTNIINEVMRGAPIENIDKEKEGLGVVVDRNKAAIVAAVKLESLINSFEGMMQNTLISIPDFSRMDATEYLVAFIIKILIVLTTAVIIYGVYSDGVGGTLGLRTLWKSLSSVALTFAAVCVIPAVFQLTYYAANKFLLQDEAMRILMLNTEKYQSGVEIGMLETHTPENTSDMAIQLDWISVPWYDQLENMLYGSTLKNLDAVKKEAYLQSPIFDNFDVTTHDDGVYSTTDQLFESVSIDYTFNDISRTDNTEAGKGTANGLYLYSHNKTQTAGFYSPYYAFLTAIVANVNEYNYYHNSYNYTTKYMSGNRIKTVGLCNSYFTSKSFMELDGDIMHVYEIYDDPRVNTYDHGYIFTDTDKELFKSSFWYNDIDAEHLTKRVDLINEYARDFVANNKDLLMKVSDETFIKVMALNMAIRYNQLFGIPSANALEIYNMDSNDLLRLSIVKTDEAILASPMSYSRYVYNFGGEPAVYAAAVLTVVMWVGSFIKPLCTVLTFCSVFASIWVFRVVLRKPSANLWGYFITVSLLCLTNVLHAVILKVSVHLPNLGLSTLGCLLFIIVGQVVYLLMLGYVTGVSLKDWSNLGYTEYDREAKRIQRKIGSKKIAQDTLNGRIPRHENNWDYYNDLVNQHRERNV